MRKSDQGCSRYPSSQIMDLPSRSTRLRSDSCPHSHTVKQPVRGSMTNVRRPHWCHNTMDRRPSLLTGTSSSRFGAEVTAFVWRSNSKRRPTSILRVSALFEKFTEQAIKGVVSSQREAKGLGATEVRNPVWLVRSFSNEKLQNTCAGACRLNQNTCCLA